MAAKMRFTKEQYEQLRPWFPVIYRAHKSRTFTGGDMTTVSEVAKKAGLGSYDLWCGSCLMQLLDAVHFELIKEKEDYAGML